MPVFQPFIASYSADFGSDNSQPARTRSRKPAKQTNANAVASRTRKPPPEQSQKPDNEDDDPDNLDNEDDEDNPDDDDEDHDTNAATHRPKPTDNNNADDDDSLTRDNDNDTDSPKPSPTRQVASTPIPTVRFTTLPPPSQANTAAVVGPTSTGIGGDPNNQAVTPDNHKPNVAAIVGGTLGGLAFLALLGVVIVKYLKGHGNGGGNGHGGRDEGVTQSLMGDFFHQGLFGGAAGGVGGQGAGGKGGGKAPHGGNDMSEVAGNHAPGPSGQGPYQGHSVAANHGAAHGHGHAGGHGAGHGGAGQAGDGGGGTYSNVAPNAGGGGGGYGNPVPDGGGLSGQVGANAGGGAGGSAGGTGPSAPPGAGGSESSAGWNPTSHGTLPPGSGQLPPGAQPGMHAPHSIIPVIVPVGAKPRADGRPDIRQPIVNTLPTPYYMTPRTSYDPGYPAGGGSSTSLPQGGRSSGERSRYSLGDTLYGGPAYGKYEDPYEAGEDTGLLPSYQGGPGPSTGRNEKGY